MAIRTSSVIQLNCLLLVLFAYSSQASGLLNDEYVSYEVVNSQSKLDAEDSFLHDMVFVDDGKKIRLRRQLRADGSLSSHVSPEDDDKSKAVPGRKKVPSGFSPTSNATSNIKTPKSESSTSVVPEKKVAEKTANPPKPVAVVKTDPRSSTPPSPTVASDPTKAPVTPLVQNVTNEKPVSNADPLPPVKWGEFDHVEETGRNSEVVDTVADHDDEFPPEITDPTLRDHHVTNKTEDHHQYYNSSTYLKADLSSYWVDMESNPKVTVNAMLSQAHRRAATVALNFEFPFYGHLVKNVTIATGGFLYTGEYVHSWLAATQYIAPLMANFDTSISNESFVKYVDNGTAFTVEWCKVALQDRPKQGDFSFQVTLHKSGDIVFVYKNIPVLINKIKDDNHPVKVGLSDAYIIDRTIFFVRRKTIYEYHRVNFPNIQNGTVIYLRALQTCLDMKDCTSCLTKISNFECNWCPSARRCSNGMDRYRQDWLLKGCEPSETNGGKVKQRSDQCTDDDDDVTSSDTNHVHEIEEPTARSKSSDSMPIISHPDHVTDENLGVSMSGVVGILLLVVFVCSVGLWVLYAYRHPHSTSGQWLIRYRPSTWSWRRGEARYTAATIHM